MKWIISNIRMLLLAGAVLSLTATGSYLVGLMVGKQAAINSANAQALGKVETRTEIEYITALQPRSEKQKELEEKWCRDCR